jgi:putative tryptophan/tyrosine transport system substrate-binding protein
MRRVGVLMSTAAEDPESRLRLAAFVQGLQQAGWRPGQNLQLDTLWASGDAARLRQATTELLTLAPDIIVVGGRAATVVPQIRQAGHDVPIVFVQGVDPVGTGYVASLARPGVSPSSSTP